MHTNLIAPLSCCRESVKYTCICKMSVVSTLQKKKRKEKTSESIISHANDWYMATISRATGISPILQRINQHFQKLLLLHVKRLAVLSLHFKLHLIKKKWDIKSFFPLITWHLFKLQKIFHLVDIKISHCSSWFWE